jgi:hypothetical protein
VDWTPREEKALVDAVAIVGVGRWAVVLSKFGHKFHAKRTASHLKVRLWARDELAAP